MSTIFRENGVFKIKTGKSRSQSSGSVSGRKSGNRGSILTRKSYSQKCIVKAKYVNLTTDYGIKASEDHEKYILRENALEGLPDLSHYNSTLKSDKEFRIILSPENQIRDMNLFTRIFIDRVQKETGYQFNHLYCVHNNTAHKHSHIIIKGTDLNVKEVYFNKDFIKHQMRIIASKLSTQFLGPSMHKNYDYEPFIEKLAVTKLDRKIKDIVNKSNILHEKTLNTGVLSKELTYCKKRLFFLQSKGLVIHKNNDKTWKFSENWYSKLSDYSRCSTFLEATKFIRYSHPSSLELYDHIKHGTIVGQVTQKGLIDESSNKQYALIETIDGKAIYCHLGFVINKLKPGQIVSYNPGQAFEITKPEALNKTGKNNLKGFGKQLDEGSQHETSRC